MRRRNKDLLLASRQEGRALGRSLLYNLLDSGNCIVEDIVMRVRSRELSSPYTAWVVAHL